VKVDQSHRNEKKKKNVLRKLRASEMSRTQAPLAWARKMWIFFYHNVRRKFSNPVVERRIAVNSRVALEEELDTFSRREVLNPETQRFHQKFGTPEERAAVIGR